MHPDDEVIGDDTVKKVVFENAGDEVGLYLKCCDMGGTRVIRIEVEDQRAVIIPLEF